MSIQKKARDRYELICDECGYECPEPFEDFHAAVEYKREWVNGWRSVQNYFTQEWSDQCRDCARGIRGVHME